MGIYLKIFWLFKSSLAWTRHVSHPSPPKKIKAPISLVSLIPSLGPSRLSTLFLLDYRTCHTGRFPIVRQPPCLKIIANILVADRYALPEPMASHCLQIPQTLLFIIFPMVSISSYKIHGFPIIFQPKSGDSQDESTLNYSIILPLWVKVYFAYVLVWNCETDPWYTLWGWEGSRKVSSLNLWLEYISELFFFFFFT